MALLRRVVRLVPEPVGTVTVRNFPEVPVEVPFSKIWDNLKFALTGHFEAAKDRFGFGINFLYIKEGSQISGQIPELLGASVALREVIADGFGIYRIARAPAKTPGSWNSWAASASGTSTPGSKRTLGRATD
jgi:hypothetical protein